MHSRPTTWSQALDFIFDGFACVEEWQPDWLGPGRSIPEFSLDRLYPEVGLAIKFRASRSAQSEGANLSAQLSELCSQAGLALVVVEGELDAGARTLAEIRTTLSIANRRVAQQRGALDTKRSLIPRIACARAAAQEILDEGRARERARSLRAKAAGRPRQETPAFLQNALASVGAVLAFLFAILKRLLLVVVVLVVVNLSLIHI